MAQLVIVDDKDSVDVFLKFFDACCCLLFTAFAFEREGHSDDGHNKDARHHFVVDFNAFGYLGDNGSCTGASAATHTCCDEEHLGVVADGFANLVLVLKGGFACVLGDVTGTEFAKFYFVGYRRCGKSLGVGVANDEVYSVYSLAEHMIDSVASTATNADDLDFGRLLAQRFKLHRCCRVHKLRLIVAVHRKCAFFHYTYFFVDC